MAPSLKWREALFPRQMAGTLAALLGTAIKQDWLCAHSFPCTQDADLVVLPPFLGSAVQAPLLSGGGGPRARTPRAPPKQRLSAPWKPLTSRQRFLVGIIVAPAPPPKRCPQRGCHGPSLIKVAPGHLHLTTAFRRCRTLPLGASGPCCLRPQTPSLAARQAWLPNLPLHTQAASPHLGPLWKQPCCVLGRMRVPCCSGRPLSPFLFSVSISSSDGVVRQAVPTCSDTATLFCAQAAPGTWVCGFTGFLIRLGNFLASASSGVSSAAAFPGLQVGLPGCSRAPQLSF